MDGEGAAGREVPIEWNGRTVAAWCPAPLAERDLAIDQDTMRLAAEADRLATRASDALPAQWEALGRLLQRSEGIASSYIEGLAVPVADLAAAEAGMVTNDVANQIADNLRAVGATIRHAHGESLTVATLNDWHRSMMAGAPHLKAHHVGRIRQEQGWIGGNSPLDAAAVTPPPEFTDELLEDLISYVGVDAASIPSGGVPGPVVQAAIAHAQFELIHPYADGNGRVGRLLIAWILTRQLDVRTSPPVSQAMARDRGGYLAGLTLFRLGHVDEWVRWFASSVTRSAQSALDIIHAAAELERRWRETVTSRRGDSAVHKVIGLLPGHPVISAAIVAEALEVSERTGLSALNYLAQEGIVEPISPSTPTVGRPHHWWIARDLLDLVDR